MGLDSSGQSNNLTTNGTIIQNKDTPSNVFATLNPLDVQQVMHCNIFKCKFKRNIKFIIKFSQAVHIRSKFWKILCGSKSHRTKW